MLSHIDRLPPISIPQLDALRDLFKLGIAEAILAQPPGDRHFADALANLVAYELISALVARLGRELMAFGAGVGRKADPDDGYDRVIGFMTLLHSAITTNRIPMSDPVDVYGEAFLAQCRDAVGPVICGVVDALVAAAPEALTDGISIDRPPELRASIAATVADWGRPDTLYVAEGLLDCQCTPRSPVGEPGEPR